jgi:hypothetical protein
VSAESDAEGCVASSSARSALACTKEASEERRLSGLQSEAIPSGLLLQAEGRSVLKEEAAARSQHPSTDPDPQAQAMKEICRLRRETMIPLEGMETAMKLFREHATVPADGVLFTDGFLTKANLAGIMKQLAGSEKAFSSLAGNDIDGFNSFREFVIWFSCHSFDEPVILDASELEVRKLSRELNMPASEIETFKRHFDSFDADGSGTIDRQEFYEMMLKCLKVPRHIGLPAGRLHQLWVAADTDGSGLINFAEFAVFFSKYFPEGGSCGMSQHYSQNGLLNALHGTYRAW